MNAQISPEQVQNLLTLAAAILLIVVLHLAGRMAWNKWLKHEPDDGLTQEERDLRLIQRHKARNR